MKADRHRRPGFYWVRFEGSVIVAEYTEEGMLCQGPDERITRKAHWHMPGCDGCFRDREVCELLSGRLEPPYQKEAKAS